jgi:predicted transcriptional regulator
MAENWVEFAQKLTQNARAGVAADRKRLKEILAAKEKEETLAAIDEGIRDAEAGRVVPAEQVRQLLPKWTEVSPKSSHR